MATGVPSPLQKLQRSQDPAGVSSQEGREDHITPGVLLAPLLAIKELLQALVLCNRPLNHLECAACPKDCGWQRLRRDSEQHPPPDLISVVGTCDDIEQAPTGD